jgi:hypothetical protein
VSPVLAFSICFYVVVNASALSTARQEFMWLFKEDNDFGNTIYISMFAITLANCTCVPVLAWLDTPRAVQYFKKWEQFQVRTASNFLNFDKKVKLFIFVVRSSELTTKI